MKALKFIVPTFMLIGGLTLSTTAVYGKKEYTAKEKKACIACHKTATSKELNKVGECYKESKSLTACADKK